MARWGGEEFLPLGVFDSGVLDSIDYKERARQLAERIRHAISIPPIDLKTSGVQIYGFTSLKPTREPTIRS